MNGGLGRLDVGLLIDAVRHRLVWLIVPTLLVPVLAVLAIKSIGPNRTASALILVRDDLKATPVLQDVSIGVALSSRLPEVRSLVRSPAAVESVLRSLGVITPDLSPLVVEATIAGFASKIEVFGEGGGLVRITLAGRSPQLVFDALTLLTERVIQELLGPRRLALQGTTRFLKEQLDRLERELDDVEQELKRLVRDADGYQPELRRVKLDALRALSEALTKAESELAGAGGDASGDADPKRAAALSRARARLRELRQTYTDTHPSVVSAKADVVRLEAELGLEAGEAAPVASPRRDRSANQSQRKVDYLRRRMGEAQIDLQTFTEKGKQVERLEREREVKSASYFNLLKRYEEAIISRNLIERQQADDVRIVEAPGRPMVTRTSSTPFVAAAGLLGGLLMGLGMILLLELLDPTLRRPSEAEALVEAPLLGRIPGGA